MTARDRTGLYQWMDVMRFVAAAIVAVSHARDIIMVDYNGDKLYLPFYAGTGFGHSGVIVFFVLSGFWISRSVLSRIDRDTFWTDYLIDRMSRLCIVLVPALLLGGALDYVGLHVMQLPIYSGASGAHSVNSDVANNLGLPVFLGNLFFLQTIAVSTWGSNGPLWSLAAEFWYYIWFPALFLLVRRRRLSIALLALVIGVFKPVIALGFFSWLIGLGLFLALRRYADAPVPARWRSIVATATWLVMMVASGALKAAWTDVPLALTFAWMLFEWGQSGVAMPKSALFLANYGSRSSFSLYILHFPLLVLIGGYLARAGRFTPTPLAVAIVLILTLIAIGAGWLFSQATERHTTTLRDFSRAIVNRRRLSFTDG